MNSAADSTPIIGLLGAPGSGKSAVAAHFAELGCGVIDADQLAKRALDTDAVRDQLARWWGGRVVGDDGKVDRKAVASIVFDRPDELVRLESIVHPKVHEYRRSERERFAADANVIAIVEDCPLLLEKNLEADCDVLVYIDAPRQVRLARVAEHRGWSEADLDQREKQQWPLDTKRSRSDYVIDNGGNRDHSLAQTRQVLSQITRSRA